MQECCCGGGITLRGEVAVLSSVAAVGRGLCSPPGSVGYLSNQPQEVRTMGRWVGQFPRVANSNVSPIPMCSFCYWSHCLFPVLSIAVVTGASEGIGRGYALEVSVASSCCCAVS